MKKGFFDLLIVMALISAFLFHASAAGSEKDEILSLFDKATGKIENLAYANYPDGIMSAPIEYSMRITTHPLLDSETADGLITASEINEEMFLAFYSEAFSNDVASYILDNPDSALSVCGAFRYEGKYFIIPGYVWNLRELLVGPDSEHSVALCYGGGSEGLPYDNLKIDGNKAVMLLTLRDPQTKASLGQYDLRFCKTDDGWRVYGGSFLELFIGSLPDGESSPQTADENLSRIYALAAAAAFSAMICGAAVTVRRRKVS